jgi:S1-C subfamily serine protease
MVLGGPYVEPVKTRGGGNFLAEVVVAEPVADIAVLGPADSQEIPEDCEAFEAFANVTEAVPLFTRTLHVGACLPVQVLAPKGRWITGRVIRYGLQGTPPCGKFCLKTDAKIEAGYSGGPVVNQTGQLVGIVSNGIYSGTVPVPWFALPRWLGTRIMAAHRAAVKR